MKKRSKSIYLTSTKNQLTEFILKRVAKATLLLWEKILYNIKYETIYSEKNM